MAQQKQLIPGNTELYNKEECDNTFIKKSGETTVTNFKLIGNTNIQGDISANTVSVRSNILCDNADVFFNNNASFIAGYSLRDNPSNWSYLNLYANNSNPAIADNKGSFILAPACDGDGNRKQLKGYPTGELKWGNNHLVQSVNGNKADADGNISITSVSSATSANIAEKDSSGNIITSTYVNLANDQIITGTKTFKGSPVIPNPSVNSDTNIAASTKWVNDKIRKSREGGTWKKLVDKDSFNWWSSNDSASDYNEIELINSCFEYDYLVICMDDDDKTSTGIGAYYLNWFPNFILHCSASSPQNTTMNNKSRILTASTYGGSLKVQFIISEDGKKILKPGDAENKTYENSICTGIYGVNIY